MSYCNWKVHTVR